MNKLKLVFVISSLSVLQACGGGSMSIANHRVGGFHPDGCDGYEQTNKNIEGLISYAEELKAEGKISEEKLIEVDQEAGIYSQNLTSACRFLLQAILVLNSINTLWKRPTPITERLDSLF